MIYPHDSANNQISPEKVIEWKQAFLDGKLYQETIRLERELEACKKKYEAAQKTLREKELEVQFLMEKTRTAR